MPDNLSAKSYSGQEGVNPEKIPLKIEPSELQELKERIKNLEAQLKKEKVPEERERMVKQEIKVHLQRMQKMPTFAAPQKVRDEADEITKFPSTQQVGALVSLVFEKGLEEAISVAQALKNPAVLDEFHDILIDRYYHILIEKEILKYI